MNGPPDWTVLVGLAPQVRAEFDPECLVEYEAMNGPPDWHVLVGLAPRVRAEFNPECLVEYEARKWSPVLRALRSDPSLIQPRTVDLKQEVLEVVFGAFGPHHAFNAFTPDWGIKLIERKATEGLSYLLNRGKPELRAKRIRAFLEALEVPDLPDNRALERAKAFAEQDRIDLEIRFPTTNDPMDKSWWNMDKSWRIVVIEAKFESPLRPRQLSNYYKARENYQQRHFRIVGLTPKAGQGRKGPQVRIWRVHLWRDVWLQFEKQRPVETDGQLAAFMALLWQRIGGLA